MPQIGANIEQLQSLNQQFNKQAAQVDALIAAINNQLGGTWWIGPRAEKFKGQWDQDFTPTLKKLSEALRAAGQDVKTTAERLQAAGS
jgi:uncharacterized protein YukE